ncbi:MAG: HNH endonuclease [Candidatus Poribacteria bacterium]|nr:HNH endonuclease [Candidatus Poribacteria bacterium]
MAANWMSRSVLVLNASYEAIHICDVRRAVKMLVKGVASAEEASEHALASATNAMPIPYVIRLRQYVHIPHRPVKFSRRNVLIRDQHTCQYCQRPFQPGDLTLDHVQPRSKGGPTNWENVVSACRKCNHKKGDRTPREAHMMPMREPKAPSITYYMRLTRFTKVYHESWRKYLFMGDAP